MTYLLQAEIAEYVKRFNALDDGKKGFVSINDIRRSFKVRLTDWNKKFSLKGTVSREKLLNCRLGEMVWTLTIDCT